MKFNNHLVFYITINNENSTPEQDENLPETVPQNKMKVFLIHLHGSPPIPKQ